jgi:exopolyphosphatase/guanosine-5'-triphosphate,3'-diphosphate pyrophosphatase
MKNPSISSQVEQSQYYAAVDLGSNSFHLVVVQVNNGSVQIIGKVKQKVRLAAGLDKNNYLDELSMERGWKCLESFAERLTDIPSQNIKVVGTATLRLATNASTFLQKGEQILKHPINVISGEEEAKQIYLGVAYTSANQGNSLVIDIGGASTEVVVGSDMQPIELVSLDVGCVTFMTRFFPNQSITEKGFEQAIEAAKSQITPFVERFKHYGWSQCLGASGTPQATNEILLSRGVIDPIKLNYLHQLKQQAIECGHVTKLDFAGLAESRKAIFPSGLAILIALFESLSIEHMQISSGALREGLIYGMLDQEKHTDLRAKTLETAIERFHIDNDQAFRVSHAAHYLYQQYCNIKGFSEPELENVILAAARLHEIGLHIDYKKYHQHGAYIIEHIAMLGFSPVHQQLISVLVGSHRQSIDLEKFAHFTDEHKTIALDLCRILRLAVLLCLRRKDNLLPTIELTFSDEKWSMMFPNNWLKKHPLIEVELANESWLQHKAGWKLDVKS